MYSLISTVATLAAAALLAGTASARAVDAKDSLLSRISDHKNLTAFASLIRTTGPEGAPSPDLELRFNNAFDNTPYTIFAPSNEAFSKISSQTLQQLQKPYNYEVLLSIIRSHIVKGEVDAKQLMKNPRVTSVEGIELPIQTETKPIRIAGQAAVMTTNIRAANGVIHIIDTLIDPFMEYFQFSDIQNSVTPGVLPQPIEKEPIDIQLQEQQEGRPATKPQERPELIVNAAEGTPEPLNATLPVANITQPLESAQPIDETAPANVTERWTQNVNSAWRTMSDILKFYPQLSNATSLLEATDPVFLNTVLASYLDAEGHDMAHFFVPSNTAFNALPYGSFDAMCAPSNRALSTYLVTFGYTTQSIQPSIMRFRRPLAMVQSEKGLEMIMVNTNGGTRVQNAMVEGEPLCTRNGCVWIVDRFLDPVFGKFGSSLLMKSTSV